MRSPSVLATVLMTAGAAAAQSAYRFVVNGEPDEVHFVAVEWPPTQPGPGDVVWVGGFEFVLDEPGLQRLERHDRNLYRLDGDERVLIGLYVAEPSVLCELSPVQLAALRCIEFAHWQEDFATALEHIDPTRCFIRFVPQANFDGLLALPADLRYLDLHFTRIKSLDGIERFRDLLFLRAPAQDTFTSVAPIAELRALRYLELDETGVRDLSLLGDHATLRTVRAAHAPIEKLPATAMAALTDLVAFDTGCPPDEISRFRKLQPRTRLITTRRELLLEAIARATRLRIRSGCICHPSDRDTQVMATDDRNDIKVFVDLLQMVEQHANEQLVPGCGDHTFEFYDAHGHLLVDLGRLGDGMLRSHKLWDISPARLRSEAIAPLRAWLTARGARLPD